MKKPKAATIRNTNTTSVVHVPPQTHFQTGIRVSLVFDVFPTGALTDQLLGDDLSNFKARAEQFADTEVNLHNFWKGKIERVDTNVIHCPVKKLKAKHYFLNEQHTSRKKLRSRKAPKA